MAELNTPLSMRVNRLGECIVVDADGLRIVNEVEYPDPEEIAEIVRRVNCHDQLVTALEYLVLAVDEVTGPCETVDSLAVDHARAALAAAKGEAT